MGKHVYGQKPLAQNLREVRRMTKVAAETTVVTQFIDACRGTGKTSADFAYGGPLTEAILLGCVASRFPKPDLAWDAKALKFDKEEANAHAGRVYREGWTIPGLG